MLLFATTLLYFTMNIVASNKYIKETKYKPVSYSTFLTSRHAGLEPYEAPFLVGYSRTGRGVRSINIRCSVYCSTSALCRAYFTASNECIVLSYAEQGLTEYTASILETVFQKLNPVVRSCHGLVSHGYTEDGVYLVNPDDAGQFDMYCELDPDRQDGSDSTGWTVIQRRVDDSVDFYRNWADYADGFGDIAGNYWMGLDKIVRITSTGSVRLLVYLETFDNNWAYALYNNFAISDSSDNYRLSVSGYSGTAGDSLSAHSGREFSTQDMDHDSWPSNCAELYKGAWWYAGCHSANLNGLYLSGAHESYADGINWFHYRGHYYSLKTAAMKIKPSTI